MADYTNSRVTRRRVMSALAAGSAVGIAGCMGGDGNGSGNGDNQSGGSDNDTGQNGNNQSGGADNDTDSESSGDSVTLEWSHWEPVADSPENEEMAQQFSEEHENIDAEYVVPHPGEPQQGYHQQVTTQIAAGEAADVMTLQPEATYPALAGEDYLTNLIPMIEEDDEISLDEYHESFINALYRWEDGNVYALPCQMSSIAFYYDETIWADAGVEDVPDEWTWEEFRSSLQQLSDNGVENPYVIPFTQSITKPFYQFLWQNGGNIVNEDRTECVIHSDANVEALEFIVGLHDDGLASYVNEIDAPDYGGAMQSRTAASVLGGPWVLREAQRNDNAEGLATTTIPKPSDGEQACIANSHAVSINADAENQEESFELLKYLVNGPYVEERLTLNRGLSPLTEHQDHEHIQETPQLAAHAEMLSSAQAFFFGSGTSDMIQLIVPQLQAAFTGDKTPDAALETAQQQINSQVLNN